MDRFAGGKIKISRLNFPARKSLKKSAAIIMQARINLKINFMPVYAKF